MLLFEEKDPYFIQLQLLKNLHENRNHKKKRNDKILRDLADLRLSIVFVQNACAYSQYCKFYVARSNLCLLMLLKKSTVVRFNRNYNNFIFLWLRLLKNMDIPHIVRLNAYKMHFVQVKKYFFWFFPFLFYIVLSDLSYELSFDSFTFIFPNFHVISVLTYIMDLPLPPSLVQGMW